MDALTLLLAAIVVVAAGILVVVGISRRRLARSVDDAVIRLGEPPSRRDRSAVLRRAMSRLQDMKSRMDGESTRLIGALDGAPIGVIITDGSGVVAFANPAAQGFLEARLGEAVAEVRIKEAVGQAIGSGEAAVVEISLYTPARRVLLVNALPLYGEGEPVGAAAYVQDITESRRVDEIRRDFIANVSHELKTPLGAMALLAETIGSHAPDPETTRRLTERLGEESDRLSGLIDDILDLSRAETSPSRFEPIALGALIDDVAAAAHTRAAELGVRFVVECLERDVAVRGDHRQLRSMIFNLVDNAVKYSHPGREGEDARPQVRLRAFAAGDRAVIDVEDEGIGIPESHQARIFERFYRVDRARSRATGGTGLGLSIVRHVAVNHGGSVTVESKVGEGSLFRVTLPLSREPA